MVGVCHEDDLVGTLGNLQQIYTNLFGHELARGPRMRSTSHCRMTCAAIARQRVYRSRTFHPRLSSPLRVSPHSTELADRSGPAGKHAFLMKPRKRQARRDKSCRARRSHHDAFLLRTSTTDTKLSTNQSCRPDRDLQQASASGSCRRARQPGPTQPSLRRARVWPLPSFRQHVAEPRDVFNIVILCRARSRKAAPAQRWPSRHASMSFRCQDFRSQLLAVHLVLRHAPLVRESNALRSLGAVSHHWSIVWWSRTLVVSLRNKRNCDPHFQQPSGRCSRGTERSNLAHQFNAKPM